MNRKGGLGFLLATTILAVSALPVFAAPPQDIHIEVLETFAPDEPFVASGNAVADGLICSSGTVNDESVSISGPPAGTFRILHVLKRFTCGDGSGTFDVKMTVYLDLTTNETTANWKVQAGTGAYAGLHGNGSLIGIPQVPGVSILDLYDGAVH